MVIDETELIAFFGVAPVDEDPEAKGFFGSSTFEVTDRDLTLSISFSAHHEDASLHLTAEDSPEPLLHATIRDLTGVRIEGDGKTLVILGTARGSGGGDPLTQQRAAIALAPLRIVISD